VLDAYLFARLDEVGSITTSWQEENNADHPHESLQGLPPYEYAKSVLEP
jgi:putative transposase